MKFNYPGAKSIWLALIEVRSGAVMSSKEGSFMATKHSLTSRTEKCCPQCGQEFILAAPKEVLSIQPTQVDLICSGCHFPGRAVVTEMNQIQSVYPSPDAASPIGVALDSAGWLTANRFYSLPSGLAT